MKPNGKIFNYPTTAKALLLFPACFSLLIGLVITPQAIEKIYLLISTVLTGSYISPKDIRIILFSFIPFLLSGYFFATYTPLIINENGIEVRTFLFFPVFIPWENVLSISSPSLPLMGSSQRWSFIRVKKLTIFHRMISLSYWLGFKPTIYVSNQINNYHELVEEITQRT